MKVEEYQSAIAAITTCARMLTMFDLSALLADIDRAQTVGPLYDPTLYREKHQALREDKELVKAAIPLHKLGRMLAEASMGDE